MCLTTCIQIVQVVFLLKPILCTYLSIEDNPTGYRYDWNVKGSGMVGGIWLAKRQTVLKQIQI